jgi:hypothetical protein
MPFADTLDYVEYSISLFRRGILSGGSYMHSNDNHIKQRAAVCMHTLLPLTRPSLQKDPNPLF